MSERTYRWTLAGIAVFLALWITFPFLRFASYSGYQGLIPLRSGDEGAYYDRIQTALLGRWGEVDNGITGPGIHGVGSAGVELVTGFLLQKTGLHGPEAGVLLMIAIAPLFFVLFALFLRKIGASKGLSLGATAVYTVMMLGSLQRPVSLSFVLPYTALVLLLFASMLQRGSWWRIALSALVIGLLPAVYFWSWTFLWASLACAFVLHFFVSSKSRHITWRIVIAGGVGFILSLPILIHTWLMQVQSPAYADVASNRSGLYHSYAIESVPRSALLLLLTIAAIVLFVRKKEKRESLIIPVSLVIGALLVMHQNLIHGKDLMFSSHYYPFVCLAAVVMAVWVLAHERLRPFVISRIFRLWASWIVLGITAAFLVAGFSDYRITWQLPFADPAHLDMQHLAPVLQQLSDGKRQTILTDAKTALMIKAWTDDDVVFTPYVQSLLVTDEEYIRRSCLSEAFAPGGPDIHAIAFELTQFRGIDMIDAREAQVRATCELVFQNLRGALNDYHVDALLWNELSRPDWKIDSRLFTKVQSGSGWSLWTLKGR